MTKEEAIKRAKKDADKHDIQTTAEGKSYLRARYKYYMRRNWVNKFIFLFVLIFIFILGYAIIRHFDSIKDLDCPDFASQKEAQALFLKSPKDVYRLDANHNGVACEKLPK